MKKTKTIEYAICDFCPEEKEVLATGVVHPTGKDACPTHLNSCWEEVRLPDELGGDMSGFKVYVDPEYNARMVIEYEKENK